MAKKVPTVAIVGRTNVGKSTLFNLLVGKRQAVVKDIPGVTRDRNYAYVERYNSPFSLIDTGGLVGEEDNPLALGVREQAQLAIDEADLVIAVLDGLSGIHPQDHEVSDILRRSKKPIVWTVNKCERPTTAEQSAEFYALGIKEFVTVSAAHNVAIDKLIELVTDKLDLDSSTESTAEQTEDRAPSETSIRIAIVGKPNAGKSTLVNKLLGEQRLVTSELAGTTTDSVDIELRRDGQQYTLVDTAGLRKKAKVDQESIERFSNLRALKALASCDVALLVIDATQEISEQIAKIGGLIHERGRGFVLAVNKWDAVEKDHTTVKEYKEKIKTELKFAPYAPVIFISGLSGKRCPSIFDAVLRVYSQAQVRIPTATINKVLTRTFESKPPPVYRGAPIKLYFATQVDIAPPSFALFLNHPRKINFSYQRYIKNSLRKEFGFEGNDIKIHLRKSRRAE